MNRTDEDKRERDFLRALQNLVKTARSQGGMVTEEQIGSMVSELELTEEQTSQVRSYLAANKIGTEEPLPAEELLTEEEHNYLEDYREQIEAIDIPEDSVLDAIKLGAMAGEEDRQMLLAQYMLGKVLDTAKLYAGQGVFLEDLVGAGNEELLRGVRMLAPLEGPEEVEPALLKMVMDTMEDLVAANLDEKASDQQAADLVNRVADAARELASDLGHKVTVEELAAEGEITEDEIRDALSLCADTIEDIEVNRRES